jgi:hypothetical protein
MPRASSFTKVEHLPLATITQGQQLAYGAVPSSNQAIGAAILAKNKSESMQFWCCHFLGSLRNDCTLCWLGINFDDVNDLIFS